MNVCLTLNNEKNVILKVFFVFLENQNKTGSTRGGSTKEARLYESSLSITSSEKFPR